VASVLPRLDARLTSIDTYWRDGQYETVPIDGDQIRDGLISQWRAIAAAIPEIDLDRPSRIQAWRNREIVAHLSLQPFLLRQFLGTATAQSPVVTLAENLAGTASLAEMIYESAKNGADLGRVEFAQSVDKALPALLSADLGQTVVTLQGPIGLRDYLITRCVEAVVHGCDLVEPVNPDRDAQTITVDALIDALAVRAPHLVHVARGLPPSVWIDLATGRRPGFGDLEPVVPVMT